MLVGVVAAIARVAEYAAGRQAAAVRSSVVRHLISASLLAIQSELFEEKSPQVIRQHITDLVTRSDELS